MEAPLVCGGDDGNVVCTGLRDEEATDDAADAWRESLSNELPRLPFVVRNPFGYEVEPPLTVPLDPVSGLEMEP